MTPVQIGNATLYCGDCRDILPTLGQVDAVVTDPPYGVGFKGTKTKHTDNRADGGGYISCEDTPAYVLSVVVPIIDACIERFHRVVLTPGLTNLFAYKQPKSVGAIFYPSGANLGPWGFTCFQPILYYGKCPYLAASKGSLPNSFQTTEATEVNGHPCPKPIGQMRWIVNRASLDSETILDPFMGSGTTGVACAQLNRKFIGIEIEPKYFDSFFGDAGMWLESKFTEKSGGQ